MLWNLRGNSLFVCSLPATVFPRAFSMWRGTQRCGNKLSIPDADYLTLGYFFLNFRPTGLNEALITDYEANIRKLSCFRRRRRRERDQPIASALEAYGAAVIYRLDQPLSQVLQGELYYISIYLLYINVHFIYIYNMYYINIIYII